MNWKKEPLVLGYFDSFFLHSTLVNLPRSESRKNLLGSSWNISLHFLLCSFSFSLFLTNTLVKIQWEKERNECSSASCRISFWWKFSFSLLFACSCEIFSFSFLHFLFFFSLFLFDKNDIHKVCIVCLYNPGSSFSTT